MTGNVPLGVVIIHKNLNVKRPGPQILSFSAVRNDCIKMAAVTGSLIALNGL